MRSSKSVLGTYDNAYRLPEPGGFDFSRFELTVSGDLVVGTDFHMPFYDRELMARMIVRSRELQVKRLAIGGDLFNFGYLSTFRQYYEMRDESLDADIRMGREMFEALLAWMDEVIILPGNHDQRLQKALLDKSSGKALWDLFIPEKLRPKVTISRLPYLWIDTPRGRYRLTHPKSYSRTPLAVPRNLAEKYHCHVISAHGHHFAVGSSPSGYTVAESGGLFDPTRVDYRYLSGDTTHPEWSKGFIILKEGRVIPFGDGVGR